MSAWTVLVTHTVADLLDLHSATDVVITHHIHPPVDASPRVTAHAPSLSQRRTCAAHSPGGTLCCPTRSKLQGSPLSEAEGGSKGGTHVPSVDGGGPLQQQGGHTRSSGPHGGRRELLYKACLHARYATYVDSTRHTYWQ